MKINSKKLIIYCLIGAAFLFVASSCGPAKSACGKKSSKKSKGIKALNF